MNHSPNLRECFYYNNIYLTIKNSFYPCYYYRHNQQKFYLRNQISTTLNEDEQQERLVDILTNGYPKPHPLYDELGKIDFNKIDFTKIKIFRVN
jgi:hypothetical protein